MSEKKKNIPEYIEGIPTKKACREKRVELVDKYYKELWRRLDRENSIRLNNGQNPIDSGRYIVNDFLQANIHIIENLSNTKAINESVNNWQSTYAVKHLYKVVKNARPLDMDNIEFDKPKSGQKKKGFKQMVILYHKFINNQFDYLNFTVKLTIGIKNGEKHIQYAVNKIDIKK